MHVKSYYSKELKARPALTPGHHKQVSSLCPRKTASNQDIIWAIVLHSEMLTTQNIDKDNHPGHRWKNAAAFYLINFSPEFQTPYLHFPSPYKKGHFKMEFNMVC